MKKYRKCLIMALIFNVLLLAGYGYFYYKRQIPEKIRVRAGEEENLTLNFPFSSSLTEEEEEEENEAATVTLNVKLFGIIPLQRVEVDAVTPQSVVVGGSAIGIHVNTNGILVLGTTTVTAAGNGVYEPCKNRIKTGDYLVAVNGQALRQKEDLVEILKKCDGKALQVQFRRNGELLNTEIKPVLGTDGSYKIGAWVRDDTQGIGTLTYILPDGSFGALGHGITDTDTGGLVSVGSGSCYLANILRIVPGKAGSPGEMSGFIRRTEGNYIGTVEKNTERGIYGKIDASCNLMAEGIVCEIGLKRETVKGKAVIFCEIDQKVEAYEIEIEKVDYANNNHSKGLVLRVTDERLLQKTGGIVQGMFM